MPSPPNVSPTDPLYDQDFPPPQGVREPASEVFGQPDPLVLLCYLIAEQRLALAKVIADNTDEASTT